LPPWQALPVERAVFCGLWSTGPDTTLDGVVRLQALRPGAAPGSDAVFDRFCNPFDGEPPSSASFERIAREFGVAREELTTLPHASAVWTELEEFLGDRPLIVLECESFEAWRSHFTGRTTRANEAVHAPRGGGVAVGLSEMAGLFFPGRLAQQREALVSALSDGDPLRAPRAFGPAELRSALRELVARFLDQPEDVWRVCVSGYLRAWSGISAAAPRAADRMLFALALVDRPSAWSGEVQPGRPAPDGLLRPCFAHELPLEDLLETVAPRCTRESQRWASAENLPPEREEPLPFEPADHQLLEDVFRAHLPELFAAEHGAHSYRAGQHEVARAVAGALGTRELLLVHAPTGTGKTLAYLVPAMLWARRHSVRIGIATYTRALQEQAMDREVPRALSALARAGFAGGVRVSVLKGRENYLCWRALKLALPTDEDGGEAWLAWTVLALFGLSEIDGDLDRLPLRCPLPLEDTSIWSRASSSLLRQVRAQTACCTHRDDRETCAAEVARRRAEKSHVVIANQAFALARQEFFKHLVFDECEHLHEQAHSAWSHSVSLRAIRGLLSRLHSSARGGRARAARRGSDDVGHARVGSGRALLDRLLRMVLEGTPSHGSITQAAERVGAAQEALDRLEVEIERFMAWRTEKARDRSERDDHSLLREFVGSPGAPGAPESGDLVEERRSFAQHAHELDATLAELAERLDLLPLRGLPRLRRTLEIIRADLLEIVNAVEAWIPLDEGLPAFRPRTFYDVERDARGDTVLASRVLLPNEFLGRSYYPSLSTGVFLSATTWLQESFESARAYLGLDRAAQPAEDEDRPPCVVRTFRAPDVFDYGRVLVAVPRDAPSILAGKDAFLEYVRRFVAHLGERTRGRMLVLFTNAQDTVRVGRELTGFFRARKIPLWFQNMEGTAKEEISELFRARVDSILLGVDTFWYGADFPGETLEFLVIVKLPYGVPDRYHHAQCAALGAAEQRRRIYLPRALAKFRQGFGRLMRRESDRGCVFILDGRVLEPRHRFFLKELPIASGLEPGDAGLRSKAVPAAERERSPASRARLVRGDTDRCIQEALTHMGLSDDVRRHGLDWTFASSSPAKPATPIVGGDGGLERTEIDSSPRAIRRDSREDSGASTDAGAPSSLGTLRAQSEAPLDIPLGDLPF
jgi:Rad3-related DNA helicase